MAASTTRKKFRMLLAALLLLSLSFFSVTAYFFMSVKNQKTDIAELAPTLFYIDISQHYLRSYLQDDDGKYDIAVSLFSKGFFDKSYTIAAHKLMQPLVEKEHAPTLVFKANGLVRKDREHAIEYYQTAAAQGYEPAIEKLAMLEE